MTTSLNKSTQERTGQKRERTPKPPRPYVRGDIVRISEDAAKRLGVPDGRRWLVINAVAVRHASKRILCEITSYEDEKGQIKRTSPSDLPVPACKGLQTWSIISCSVIYTVTENEIKKTLGCLPAQPFMRWVDETLLETLGLKPTARIVVDRERADSK
jgi:hypothetical protein